MKHFLSKVLLFLLPLMILAVSMEVALRNIPNDYSFKKEYLDAHAGEIETLVLGSSHFFVGVNPAYFSGHGFNASYYSQTLKYDLEISRKYEPRFKNLRQVVLPVSYFTFFGNLATGEESWRVKNYVLYCDLSTSASLKDHSELLSNNFKNNVTRIYSWYFANMPNVTCSDLGWGTAYHAAEAKNIEETGKEAALRHTTEDFKYLDENMAALQAMVRLYEKLGVQVLLVTPPASEAYRQHLNREQLELTIQKATEVAAQFQNCEYLNLLEDPSFVRSDFYDGDHLNEIGAKKLSLKINGLLALSEG